ncbi:hypothetical protein KFL_005740010 [Klebsormidium nitens]|uniref:AAR2 protein family n=1 Tax=Klebsormidium nitens TaxID=105231 RepID=A0A1Y1IGB0_KLENI|nr:hypothetical protein KFL_005740010 [Klebsormidium nitens]|eukprot:GAQ89890.1 hypothetical protein KFL_005740010 [Klebsormidium nitens]
MAAAYSVSLDHEEARRLAERGGTLLLLDVPHGTSFGIDQQMFVTGPRFKGVKMLPPGPHFVYYSAAGKHGGAAPVIGFFVVLKQGQVVVRQWDAPEERLAALTDEDQVDRLAGGVRTFQFDAELGAYDLHKYAAWQTLSNFITDEVVQAHEPVGGDICVVCEADVSETRPKTGAERVLQEQIDRGRERAQSGGPSKDTRESVDGAGPQSGEKLLADVTQGVIIMDRGEDQEAAAESLGRDAMSGGLVLEESAAEGQGSGLSRVDQIALMYQRKEMRKGGSTAELRRKGNGAEDMDVDTQEGAPSGVETVDGSVAGPKGAHVRGVASEQLERHDFAGLRGISHPPMAPLDSIASPSNSSRLASGRTSDSSNGKTSVGENRSGESSGLREAGGEAGPSSSGEKPRGRSGRCFYTDLPRLVKRKGMSATELTALNLDKSGLLETVLSKQYKGREELLLGELQFAFIAFVMGQSLESFSQWKAILPLMLGCVEAPLRTRTRLFVQFLRALYWQLRHGLLPESNRGAGDALLDEAWLEKDSFLQHLLAGFFSTLREAQPIDGELKQQADSLQSLLEGFLGWRLSEPEGGSLSDEDDEYAPTVVY